MKGRGQLKPSSGSGLGFGVSKNIEKSIVSGRDSKLRVLKNLMHFICQILIVGYINPYWYGMGVGVLGPN